VRLGLGAEAQLIEVVDDLAEVIAALNLVANLAEDFADLVFDGVRPGGLLLEAVEIGKEPRGDRRRSSRRCDGACRRAFRRSPAFPTIGRLEDEGVALALERGLHRAVLFEGVEVLQEQQPRGLLGVVFSRPKSIQTF
jgi:hypothetical protein